MTLENSGVVRGLRGAKKAFGTVADPDGDLASRVAANEAQLKQFESSTSTLICLVSGAQTTDVCDCHHSGSNRARDLVREAIETLKRITASELNESGSRVSEEEDCASLERKIPQKRRPDGTSFG